MRAEPRFATKDEAVKAHSIAHDAWWKAYTEMLKHGRYELQQAGEYKQSVFVCDNPELASREAELKAESGKIHEEAIRLFATPQYPDCDMCKSVSVFRRPQSRHEPALPIGPEAALYVRHVLLRRGAYHSICRPGATHQIAGDVVIARDEDFA